MSTLAEIKSRLPPLLRQLDKADADLKAGAEPQPIAAALLDLAKIEGAALISEVFVGKRTPGKKAARAVNDEERRVRQAEWEHKIRGVAQAVAAEVEGLLVPELDDVHGRTLEKWRKSLKSIRTGSSPRTRTLLHQARATIAEILEYAPRTPRRSGRDGNDFPPRVVRRLAHRVGYRCSNPDCQQPTAGPSDERPDAATNVGEAAHICGALPGSRRYVPSMSPAQRGAISNGIWLCVKCSRMIDRDEVRYTEAVLHEWKTDAETRAQQAVQGQRTSNGAALRETVAYLAEKLQRGGRNAHFVTLTEGSDKCPAAFRGLSFPLLVVHVEHVVVVFDDTRNGLYCHAMLAADLDRDPLPKHLGWVRIEDPSQAHLVVLPMVERCSSGR